MLIVYRTDTGEVVDNTGTSSTWPEGPPDEFAYVNTDRRGIDRADLALLRLNDDADADLVADVMAQRHRVDPATGEVELLGPYPVHQLDAAADELPADGTTTVEVVYTDTRDDAPATVTFDVNGDTADETLDADGEAVLELSASTPGTVEVAAGGLTLTLTATDPEG